MTNATTLDTPYSQPLLVSDTARRGEIAPGLLRVLRQAVGLRFAMLVLAVASLSVIQLAGGLPQAVTQWLPLLLLIEAGALLVLVMWDRARLGLGGWFLPVALGWFMLASIIEQAIIMVTLPAAAMERLGRDGLPGVGIEAIFLAVPVILATWQYGRKGLLASLATLAIGFLILTPLVSNDPTVAAIYLVGSLGRLTMIALLGYVVLQLVNGLRSEHQGLVAANRQLAQRCRDRGAIGRKPRAQPAGEGAARHAGAFADRPERAAQGAGNADDLRSRRGSRTTEAGPGYGAHRHPGVAPRHPGPARHAAGGSGAVGSAASTVQQAGRADRPGIPLRHRRGWCA